MIDKKDAYLNEKIRDELLSLQKNCSDTYLAGYSKFYRYN